MTERLHPEGATPQPEQATRPPEAPPTEFQLFMRKVLDLPDYRTEGPAAKTIKELGESIKDNPLAALKEFDAFLRGRKTGDLKDWTARQITNFMIGAGATGVDRLDSITEALNAHPVGAAAAAGFEYLTDTAISAGTNFLTEKVTGIKGARYASPLAELLSTGANTFPVLRAFVNGVNVESTLRLAQNVPITGALIERAHVAGDRMIDQALESQQGKWFWGLLIVMSKGYNKKPDAKNSASTPSTPTPATGKS